MNSGGARNQTPITKESLGDSGISYTSQVSILIFQV
jgi:hypothetical protein